MVFMGGRVVRPGRARPVLLVLLLGLLFVLVALAACPAERWVGTGKGGRRAVPWAEAGTDFARLAEPGSLTFVMLTGSHCRACERHERLFDRLLAKRPDIAVRTVPFPDELCPKDFPDRESKRRCQAVLKAFEGIGACFTPTLWALAPDGRLLARDDTCQDRRPAQALLKELAVRELGAEEAKVLDPPPAAGTSGTSGVSG